MRMLKSTLCVIFLLILATSFIACDGNGRVMAVSGMNTEITTKTSSETTALPEYTAPNKDYGGMKVTIAAYKYQNSIWKISDYCEQMAETENGEPINDALYERNRAVEELFNIKFDIYPISAQSSTTEIINAILSGDDVYKFASTNATSMSTILSAGNMIVDLNDIKNLDLTKSWWDERSVEEFTLYGVQYAVTGDISLYAQGAPVVNFFNKEMIKKYMLDNPYEIVKDGEWTLDKMIEMAHAVTHDLNGNGVTDIDDSFGFMGEGGSTSFFLLGSGIRYSNRNSDGIPEIVINNERTTSFIEKFIPFINEPDTVILNGKYSGKYSSVFFDLMLPTFKDNRALFFSNQLLVALNLRDMETDFGILPLPKLNDKQEEYHNVSNNSWMSLIIVPVTNPDLEMTGNILNAMGYYSKELVTPAFIKTTVLNKTIRDEDSVDMLKLIFSTQTYDIAGLYNWGSIRSMLSTMTSAANVNYSSEYAKIEPTLITEMNATLNLLKK